MTRNVNILKNIEDASIPDEWMTADLTHPDTNVDYHIRGEMFVCPYTNKTVEQFKANPQYNGLVAHIVLTYTIGSSEEIGRVCFYYNPLEEKYLDVETFEGLQDRNTAEVFLAMDGKRRGIMKSHRVLREAQPLRYIPKLADAIRDPERKMALHEALLFFTTMFLQKIF